MATARHLRMAGALAVVGFALAASPVCTAQFGPGHGVAAPQVSRPQFAPKFTPPPFPTGAPAFPVGAPPVPGYSYHYGYPNNYKGYYGGHGNRGWGGAYVMPYYYPVDTSAYGYDYVGSGPDLYSGPPVDPNDPSLHMITEAPPVNPYGEDPESFQPYPGSPPVTAAAPPAPTAPEPKPAEPIVLVFRNGHQQEVTNYAIMGDSLYVFDHGRAKIALADLDIPATVKANNDRGVEFEVPPAAKKKPAATPQNGTPEQSPSSPPSVASVMPE